MGPTARRRTFRSWPQSGSWSLSWLPRSLGRIRLMVQTGRVSRGQLAMAIAGLALLAVVPLRSAFTRTREMFTQHVTPHTRSGTWPLGRYHDHVQGLDVHTHAYAHMMKDAGGRWTDVPQKIHCPPFNASDLPPDVLKRRVFVALNLRDNAGVMRNLVHQLRHLAHLLPDEGQLTVSVYESNSEDDTPAWLAYMKAELDMLPNVRHHIVMGGARRREGEDRIQFLARMRNKAMEPLYVHTGPPFDNVVFINDVYFCAYEVLRLMMYNADLSCGVDLYLEPEPWHDVKHIDVRKDTLTFYDLWIARDEKGRKFDWSPPFATNAFGQHFEPGRNSPEHTHAFAAFCCWDGMAVIRAEMFHKGLRFRSTRPGDGIVSECTNMCLDMWANGYNKIVVDPQVKLTYDDPSYEWLHSSSIAPRYDDVHKVDRNIQPAKQPETMFNCYLNVGPKRDRGAIKWDECSDDVPLSDFLPHTVPFKDLCAASPAQGPSTPIPRQLIQLLFDPVDNGTSRVRLIRGFLRETLHIGRRKLQLKIRKSLSPPMRTVRHFMERCGGDEIGGDVGKCVSNDDDPLWFEWVTRHPQWHTRVHTPHTAAHTLTRHYPFLSPLLAHVPAGRVLTTFDKVLLSLGLLYHYGGVFVLQGTPPPPQSLECTLMPSTHTDIRAQRTKGVTTRTHTHMHAHTLTPPLLLGLTLPPPPLRSQRERRGRKEWGSVFDGLSVLGAGDDDGGAGGTRENERGGVGESGSVGGTEGLHTGVMPAVAAQRHDPVISGVIQQLVVAKTGGDVTLLGRIEQRPVETVEELIRDAVKGL